MNELNILLLYFPYLQLTSFKGKNHDIFPWNIFEYRLEFLEILAKYDDPALYGMAQDLS
jgi:hypothetical protein